MLYLTFSNRFEYLESVLLDRLAGESGGPFVPRRVIVPSAAVRRRLELDQAVRDGISAHVQFDYLARWLWREMGRVIEINPVSPFTPEVLCWRVLAAFESDDFCTPHPRLAAYLERADARMRFGLASRVASLIEHYITYRPQWLAAWGRGETVRGVDWSAQVRADEAWQAALWRRISAELGTQQDHPSVTFFRAVERMDKAGKFGRRGGQADMLSADLFGTGTPEPVATHVFCLPTLPPLYLDILRQLSRWRDIHLYVLNPCEAYWFEIIDRRRLASLRARHGEAGTQGHETGNAVLAEWGKQSQAMIEMLFDDAAPVEEVGSAFLPAGATHRLAALQNAILDLEELAPGSLDPTPDDRSIEVHVCHSLTREIEVLHDQLLGLFADLPDLSADEVLVVTPDLAAAAPLIDAVFGTAGQGMRIPYTITGRPVVEENPVAAALQSLLDLPTGRYAASTVFDLLRHPPIARRFDLVTEDLDQIHAWLLAADIRWGLDAAQQAGQGGGSAPRHSFAAGLERLFLAYAVGEGGLAAAGLLAGVVPAGTPEGQGARVLGLLWRLLQALSAWQQACAQAADAASWRSRLHGLMVEMLGEDPSWLEGQRETSAIIDALCESIVLGGGPAVLPFEVIREALRERLASAPRGGLPSGAVTFAALPSLRNLPYRVICMIGMNDEVFPGRAEPDEFDLIARAPQRGDRQRRDDERNLFLDLVLAARDRLYISYAGYNPRDASARPPSILVSRLLDTLAEASLPDAVSLGDPAAMARARRALLVEHPLQAFSAAYFDPADEDYDLRRRSFQQVYCEALRQQRAMPPAIIPLSEAAVDADWADDASPDDETALPDSPVQAPFFAAPLPEPSDPSAQARRVDLDALKHFFRQPAEALLRDRLGIRFPRSEALLEDVEPFALDYLSGKALAGRLLPAALAGASDAALQALAAAGGEFPDGSTGRVALAEAVQALQTFAEPLRTALASPLLPPVEVRIPVSGGGQVDWEIAVRWSDLRAEGLVRYRYDDLRAGDALFAWLDHLVLCAAAPAGVAPRTRCFGQDGEYAFRPVAEPGPILAELLALYAEGQRAPLHFFPKSAWSYLREGGDIKKARASWRPNHFTGRGESLDPAYRLALRGVDDPLDAAFESAARTVFGPLLAHLEGA